MRARFSLVFSSIPSDARTTRRDARPKRARPSRAALVLTLLALLGLLAAPAAAAERHLPDDPSFPDQWAMDQASGCDVDAPEAWAHQSGSPKVILAILDTGVDLDAQAFTGRMLPGRNIPASSDNADDHDGRGTQLAALAAARGDDAAGIAGLCWECLVLPVRVSRSDGTIYSYQAAAGIEWAADQGADLILLAQAHPHTTTMWNAVKYARSKGALVVGPMGDYPTDTRYYPASFHEALGVGATDDQDHWAGAYTGDPSLGSTHNDRIELSAPGDFVLASGIGGSLERVSRTRFAAALVTGAAGLALSTHHTLGVDELRHLLRSGSRDQVGDPAEDLLGWDEYHGHGRLDAARTLDAVRSVSSLVVEPLGTAGTRVRLAIAAAVAQGYDFVRGDVAALGTLHNTWETTLGTLTCLADDAPTPEATGALVDEDPAPGAAFFYLARLVTRCGDAQYGPQRSYGGSSRRFDRRSWTGDCGYAPLAAAGGEISEAPAPAPNERPPGPRPEELFR